MEEKTPVYIGAEDIMRLKAELTLADIFMLFHADKATKQEKERLRDAFIACIEAVEIKEGFNV